MAHTTGGLTMAMRWNFSFCASTGELGREGEGQVGLGLVRAKARARASGEG